MDSYCTMEYIWTINTLAEPVLSTLDLQVAKICPEFKLPYLRNPVFGVGVHTYTFYITYTYISVHTFTYLYVLIFIMK